MNIIKKAYNDYVLLFKILFFKFGKGKHPYEIMRKEHTEWYQQKQKSIEELVQQYKKEYEKNLSDIYNKEQISEQLNLFGDRFYRKAFLECYNFKNPKSSIPKIKIKDDIERIKNFTNFQIFLFVIPITVVFVCIAFLICCILNVLMH